MDAKKITIQKMGDEPKKAGRKTLKTFPRGVLKKTSKFTLKGVVDPAKAPALKKGMRKHTLRMLTERGHRKLRKTAKRRISSMSDAKIQDIVQSKGLVRNSKTPPAISRQILDNAVSAGFVSV